MIRLIFKIQKEDFLKNRFASVRLTVRGDLASDQVIFLDPSSFEFHQKGETKTYEIRKQIID